MTLNGQNALCAEKMRLLEPTTQSWMKILDRPHYQRQKSSPMTLLSASFWIQLCLNLYADIRGVPLGGGIKWEWGCQRRQFLEICVATSSETSEIGPKASNINDDTPCWPVTDCKMNDLEWPWVAISCQNPNPFSAMQHIDSQKLTSKNSL